MSCDEKSSTLHASGDTAPAIELPKRLLQPALSLPLTAVLSLTPERNQFLLWYRHKRSNPPTSRRLGAADPGLGRLTEAWNRHQRHELEQRGALEGCALQGDATPVWLLILATVCGVGIICGALFAFARTAYELWPLIADLPGDARGWYLLALGAYTAGGVALTGLFLVILGRHLADRRNVRLLAEWRIDRRGLSRRSADGDWELIGPHPGDRVDGTGFTFGGTRFRHATLSGQPLARQLLSALASERSPSPGERGGLRASALRMALLWPPILLGGGILVARALGIEELRPLWPAAVVAVALPVVIGILLLSSESRRRRIEMRAGDSRSDLLDTLR